MQASSAGCLGYTIRDTAEENFLRSRAADRIRPDSRLPFGETSAAQNGTVIKICQHCGAINGDANETCCFCDASLAAHGRASVARRGAIPTQGNLAVEPEWRREVSSRLRDYRSRRRGGLAAEFQTALPFETASASRLETSASTEEIDPPALADLPPSGRTPVSERFEISVSSPAGVSGAIHPPGPAYAYPAPDSDHTPLLPVASLPERRFAALLDGALLLFSFGGMLALFTVLGGHIGFNRLDLVVAGATFVLFYAQYFALFTIFGGSTPGMMFQRLRVVSFQGGSPSSRQMVWRSFGYLISAGTCFLGFLWALWDEEHLCWQDRISQTYLTPSE
jgi:uncharacterized RDD family membrane protein YckC